MSLSTPTNGSTILASDVSQLVQVLQQTSGSTETGKYYLLGQAYATNANMANYMQSRSRTSVPVSVSIDEADVAHGGANNSNPAVANHLTANGFLVDSSGTGITTSWQVAGNFTITY